jgi:phosphate transport system permease protein
MSQKEHVDQVTESTSGHLPSGEALRKHIDQRRTQGKVWSGVLFASTVFGFFVLIVLMLTIIDDVFGMVLVQSERPLAEVTGGRDVSELSREELTATIEENLPPSRVRILQSDMGVDSLDELSQEQLVQAVEERVLEIKVVASWPLFTAMFNRGSIEQEIAAKDEYREDAELRWYSWLNADFLSSTMNSVPAAAGIRTALLGSLWLIVITMLVALPLGVGAAIYLEEYAHTTKNPWLRRINAMIQTNINNLAGVPSIIYGMLGLAIFVRAIQPITSGVAFDVTDPTTANGRTILSGGLTLALLILPIIIINAQEAIRAVPNSLRQASLGLGATKWQTIRSHVLPVAVPGILTGTILSMSRAIGETAPLIVVGATAFITTDPSSPFAKFTVIPIQIYNWTVLPEEQFRNAAAAAIVVLLVVLLSLNAIASYLRIRARKVL